jgi:4-hydroxy-tetrahydrodipicolinate reductase
MIPLIIIGTYGRMGQAIIKLAINDHHFSIIAGVVRSKINPTNFPLYESLEEALKQHAEHHPIIIDFSHAKAADLHVTLATQYGLGLLIGTTGKIHKENPHVIKAAQHIPIVVAENTSPMAVIMQHVCKQIAHTLPHSQKAIWDIHHQHKKDAPSGTANALLEAMGRNTQMASWRLGEIIGEHSAFFVSNFERLEITHRVLDRKVFAEGALIAAQFLFKQKPGLYDMAHVLNINPVVSQ